MEPLAPRNGGSGGSDEQGDDDREERNALDEGREDNRDAANLSVGFGLTCNTLGSRAAEAANAHTSADGGEASTNAGSGFGDAKGGFYGLLNGKDHGFLVA